MWVAKELTRGNQNRHAELPPLPTCDLERRHPQTFAALRRQQRRPVAQAHRAQRRDCDRWS